MYARTGSLSIVLAIIAFGVLFGTDLSVAHAQQQVSEERSERDKEDAIDEFTRRFVWSNRTTTQNVFFTGSFAVASTDTETNYYQGRHGRKLGGRELYEVINQPEIRDEYVHRMRRGVILSGIGYTLPLGLGYLSYRDYRRAEQEQALSDEDDVSSNAVLFGVTAGVVWLACAGAGAYYWHRRDPLGDHERSELIEEYNLELLDELDLRREDLPNGDDDDRRPSSDELYVDGYFNDDGGGIVVGFTF